MGADAGRQMIVNLPTTVEHFPPNVYADRMEWFGRHFSRRDAAICRFTRTTTAERPSPPPSSG